MFVIYFSGLVGWTMHPGYQRENTPCLSVEDCASLAHGMVEMTNQVYEDNARNSHDE